MIFDHALQLFKVLESLTPLPNRYHIPRLEQSGGDIGATPIQVKVTMLHQLTRLRPRISKSQAVHNVIHPALQNDEQILARHTRPTDRFAVITAKLTL
jgi:hypothetical protein